LRGSAITSLFMCAEEHSGSGQYAGIASCHLEADDELLFQILTGRDGFLVIEGFLSRFQAPKFWFLNASRSVRCGRHIAALPGLKRVGFDGDNETCLSRDLTGFSRPETATRL
jgi:hypothetical protein